MGLTELKEWQALIQHQSQLVDMKMRDSFKQDEQRFERFSLKINNLFLDFSRHRINQETLLLLTQLAEQTHLSQKISALFSGQEINNTEKRPALHTALRDRNKKPIMVKGKNIMIDINHNYERMCEFVHAIHTNVFRGVTGKPIRHIVNIGIGGSYAGAMLCTHALRAYAITDLQFHFLTSPDSDQLHDVLQDIDPETSLFIICSKSFNTLETLTNAQTMLTWMKNKYGDRVLAHHFIAITSAKEKAQQFGILEKHIFPLWDWVGGRYSIWSSAGLPLMLQIGGQQFSDFLLGAFQLDEHFKSQDFLINMPVIMALLSIWYTNFFSVKAHAIIPYSYRLKYLIPYLQQVQMESNGKNINTEGQPIHYNTSPILFGEEGCIGQHAYHQLLHQGQHLIPVDFILVGKATHSKDVQQNILLASGLSQAHALMRGKTYQEAYEQLLQQKMPVDKAKKLAFHQMISGNKPSHILYLDKLEPKSLGALIALYEHKIFVEGSIWGINSFDQWGVELGKELVSELLPLTSNYPQTISI